MTNFDAISNYYEPMVIERLQELVAGRPEEADDDFLEDVACVALNHLPARYVRFRVDAAFYLTTEERMKMDIQVEEAVTDAYRFVLERRHREESEQA